MCESCAPRLGWSRRQFVLGAAAAGVATAAPTRPAPAVATTSIQPRTAWAGTDRPAGSIQPEPDVRFVIVHHTVNRNDYGSDDVIGLLRGIHSFHTGAEKGWPDIAYNFVVDRFGRIWETREGSLASLDGAEAVAGDATGGNQGFDQKCAFLGDHRLEPPTAEAEAAMVFLLTRLAARHRIDPLATTSFVSRGSNLHPAGATVTTSTITGHRTMSQTTCPGDAAMERIDGPMPDAIAASVAANQPAPVPSSQATAPTSTTAPGTPDPAAPEAAAGPPGGRSNPDPPVAVVIAAAGAIAVVGGAILRLRSR